MKAIRWLVACMSVALFTACGGPDYNLPPTHYIAQGSNLYEATAFLCKGNVEDEKGRGRWRRWANVNESIAGAKTMWKPVSGTTVIIQAGDYYVPRNLCANEANIGGLLLVAFLIAVVIGMTVRAMRNTRPGQAMATTDPDHTVPIRGR